MSSHNMAARYPAHTFDFRSQPQWPVDTKPKYEEEDDLSVLDERILDPTSPGDLSGLSDSQRAHFGHIGQAISSDHMWHETLPEEHVSQRQRHRSFPMLPPHEPSHGFIRIDPSYAAAYTQPHHIQIASNSGTSTPTPGYDHMQQDFHGMPMHFPQAPFTFHHAHNNADPLSAPPMSPQSSQGGWLSATSSDTTEPRSRLLHSPSYRNTSPLSHLRQDGIRKKNARFEIPADRNLHNIDSLINQTNDEQERKELKQQKRLLRNRQAALDSRQRKKQHTEKLEVEKKDFSQAMTVRDDEIAHLQNLLHQERERNMIHHQQVKDYLRQLEYERDEAIRTKTLETGELRKKNNILMGHLRDFERQQAMSVHVQPATDFSNDFSTFDHLGIDDTPWEDDFELTGGDDDMHVPNHRQATPQPPPPKPIADPAKTDMPFSWNAFYMCLLFGAFIASNSNSTTASTSALQASIPPLSDEYRAESANVLKAVLASSPESSHTLLPPSHHHRTTISSAEMARISSPPQGLDALHATLTTPSRRQQDEAAFALSATQYDHLTNPGPAFEEDDAFEEAKPSRLQAAYASMQQGRQSIDRILCGNLHKQSQIWEQVPEKVIRDFREMVEHSQGEGGGGIKHE